MQAGTPTWFTVLTGLGGIGGLGALIGGLALWWKNRRDANLAEKQDARTAAKDSVAVVDALWEQVRNATDEAARARAELTQMRATLKQQHEAAAAVSESQQNDIEGLLDRVSALEESEHHLINYVVSIHNGINAGTIPPLPTPPPAIAAIIERARRNHQE